MFRSCWSTSDRTRECLPCGHTWGLVKLFKKRKSKYFWYDFTVRGKRFRSSTKETAENRAAKIAALKFADACERGDPIPRKAPTLKQTSVRFLEWVENARLAAKTKTYYQDGWRLLEMTSILQLRPDAIDNDVAEQLSFSGSASNANCALRTLRRLLHKAEDWKLIRRAPKIKLLPEQGRLLRLDDEAERKLLAAATACNWRPRTLELFGDIVMLARDTGMRTKRNYTESESRTSIGIVMSFLFHSKTVTGIREVPLSDRALEILRRCFGDRRSGWVFLSKRARSGHLTTMAAKFRQARAKASLSKDLMLYCGPTRLRHARAEANRELEARDADDGSGGCQNSDEIPTAGA